MTRSAGQVYNLSFKMSIDSMRVGGGRCPPLLVCGLLVISFLLVCNWWSLSSENSELLHQIDDLSQQLKISAEERDQCVTLRGSLEQRYKGMEDKAGTLHVQLGQEKEVQKRKDEALTICKSELESLKRLDTSRSATLETLRLEKDAINGQLEERRDENKRLQEDLEKVQDELNKLKSTVDDTAEKKSETQPAKESLPRSSAKSVYPPHLESVPENAVKISPSGQQGLKYHGVPILPRDQPGAVRLPPRLSVTNLKQAADSTILNNDTQNGGNQDEQNVVDNAGNEHFDDNIPDNLNDLGEEEQIDDNARERAMKSTMELEDNENGTHATHQNVAERSPIQSDASAFV